MALRMQYLPSRKTAPTGPSALGCQPWKWMPWLTKASLGPTGSGASALLVMAAASPQEEHESGDDQEGGLGEGNGPNKWADVIEETPVQEVEDEKGEGFDAAGEQAKPNGHEQEGTRAVPRCWRLGA